jgi:hypothetical protein
MASDRKLELRRLGEEKNLNKNDVRTSSTAKDVKSDDKKAAIIAAKESLIPLFLEIENALKNLNKLGMAALINQVNARLDSIVEKWDADKLFSEKEIEPFFYESLTIIKMFEDSWQEAKLKERQVSLFHFSIDEVASAPSFLSASPAPRTEAWTPLLFNVGAHVVGNPITPASHLGAMSLKKSV